MDILRRSHAPISAAAWSVIDDSARDTLAASLSARRFVDVSGPHGIDFACVPVGRLSVPEGQDRADVCFGVHQVLPLVEARISFAVQQWELDNIGRGAKDVELESLVKAARRIAVFENEAVLNGFEPGGIVGLQQAVAADPIPLPMEVHGVIDAVGDAQVRLLREGIEGPAAMVVPPPVWRLMSRNTQGGTLRSLVEGQIQGPVVLSEQVTGALLASLRGGDLELTIGQDFAIGYLNHDSQSVNLYLTESFTFRVVAPEAVVPFCI
ncbi:MAG: bacteriocin family protein [Lentisphaeria bacterium]|nr:bacteriocin family protein [Lentisphaeria bacterium]